MVDLIQTFTGEQSKKKYLNQNRTLQIRHRFQLFRAENVIVENMVWKKRKILFHRWKFRHPKSLKKRVNFWQILRKKTWRTLANGALIISSIKDSF